ncbi:hypothetical protein E3P99_00344 [Wallemia hederae]|uniref:Uncharacterized protein n=1 Tax=Wallemia hederae TaxID=1540922 RepID=A0A4T0FWV1_9BASI|nr:hypothetical protein E3P99_00344 [Wallemia hederae]
MNSNNFEYEKNRMSNLLADSNLQIAEQDKALAAKDALIEKLQEQLGEQGLQLKQARHQRDLNKSVMHNIQKQNQMESRRSGGGGSGSGSHGADDKDANPDSTLSALYQVQNDLNQVTKENAEWRGTFNDIGAQLCKLTVDTVDRVQKLTGEVVTMDQLNNSAKPSKQTKQTLLQYLKTLRNSIKLLSGQKTFDFVADYDFEKLDKLREEYEVVKKGIEGLMGVGVGVGINVGVGVLQDKNSSSKEPTKESTSFKPRRSNRLNLSDLRGEGRVEDTDTREDRDTLDQDMPAPPRKVQRVTTSVGPSRPVTYSSSGARSTSQASHKRRPSAAAGTSKLAHVRARV